jgi:hypothetical protein
MSETNRLLANPSPKYGATNGARKPNMRNFFRYPRGAPAAAAGGILGKLFAVPAPPEPLIEIPPGVYEQYNELLSVRKNVGGRQEAVAIINNLIGERKINTNTRLYFSTVVQIELPRLVIQNDPLYPNKGTLTNPIGDKITDLSLLKRGAYGVIWRGANDKVYKFINTSPRGSKTIETATREVFLEMLIQVLLQSDELNGKHIGRVEKLYSYTDGLVCEMEPIPYTIESELERINRGNKVTVAGIRPLFETLGKVVTYFEKKYGFHHRDLHPGNILFDAAGTLKIIDFGKSCIRIKDTTYSLTNTECESFDPLLFLASLVENYAGYLDDTTIEKIHTYFTVGEIDYLERMTSWHEGQRIGGGSDILPAVWHYFYHEGSIGTRLPVTRAQPPTIEPWTLTVDLISIPGAGDKTFWQQFVEDGMPRRGSFEFFARAWTPAGIPAAGGARTRRAKVSRRPKATRRFKY